MSKYDLEKIVDIRHYLSDLSIPFREYSDHIHICCPICKKRDKYSSVLVSDNNYHLGICTISEKYGLWNCFLNSDHKGNFFSLVAMLENISYEEAKNRYLLASNNKFELNFDDKLAVNNVKPIYNTTLKLPKCYKINDLDSIPIQILSYLKKRAISLDMCHKFDIRYSIGNELNYPCLVFPIYLNNEIVTWTARVCSDKTHIRYTNCKNSQTVVPLKSCIYNYDKIRNEKETFIVEGIFDCIRIDSFKENCLGLFSKIVTKEQIMLLLDSKIKKINILLDGDVSLKELDNLKDSLSRFFAVEVYKIKEENKDPDLLTKEEFNTLCKNLF